MYPAAPADLCRKLVEMRLILPEYIPLNWTAVFAGVLLLVQLWQGTDLRFAGLHFLFLVIWIYAFNTAGGFRRISGAYVFWYGLLTVPVGTIIKALMNDRADSNTWTPVRTMLMYVISMLLVLGAVIVVRKFMDGRESVAEAINRKRPPRYLEAAIGLFALSLALQSGAYFLPFQLYLTVHQLDQTMPLCIILATIYVIESSGYRRTLGVANAVPIAYAFWTALAGFSKLGILLPFVAWLLGVAYTRFRLRVVHMAAIALVSWYSVYALTPLAQVGRNVVTTGDPNERSMAAVRMLMNIGEVRREFQQAEADSFESGSDFFSREVSGFWVRMTRFPGDDRLISYTSHGNYVGWAGVEWSLLNLIPHMLLPNKDQYSVEASTGNYYAREIGIINSSDTTTGISFSTVAEAYHIGGWTAVLLFLPVLLVVFLIVTEATCGDLRVTPWGLVVALYLSHVAPESGVDGLISFITFGNFGMIFTVILSSFVAPLIGSLLLRETPTAPTGLPATS